MARVKSNFNIVAYNSSGQKVTLHQNIKSTGLIALLKKEKQSIDRNYTQISVERIADGLKIFVNVGGNKDWVERVAKTLKLGQSCIAKNTHSYCVSYSIYKNDMHPVFVIDFPQETVLKSGAQFKELVCDKMFGMQNGLRVAVLRVLDIATDKQDADNQKETPIYSHVFYPSTVLGLPDLRGTGVAIRHNTNIYDRCTPVMFNRKKRSGDGGANVYFGNQQIVMEQLDNIIDIISKYRIRSLKQNGK